MFFLHDFYATSTFCALNTHKIQRTKRTNTELTAKTNVQTMAMTSDKLCLYLRHFNQFTHTMVDLFLASEKKRIIGFHWNSSKRDYFNQIDFNANQFLPTVKWFMNHSTSPFSVNLYHFWVFVFWTEESKRWMGIEITNIPQLKQTKS